MSHQTILETAAVKADNLLNYIVWPKIIKHVWNGLKMIPWQLQIYFLFNFGGRSPQKNQSSFIEKKSKNFVWCWRYGLYLNSQPGQRHNESNWRIDSWTLQTKKMDTTQKSQRRWKCWKWQWHLRRLERKMICDYMTLNDTARKTIFIF